MDIVSITGSPSARTLWEEGRMPGRDVATLATAVVLTAALADIALSPRLGLLFDLVFVTASVGAALLVRPADFFTVGTWPPLAMTATVSLLAVADSASVADPGDSVIQAIVSGLSAHSFALVIGYGLCLAILAVRRPYVARAGGFA